MIIGDIIFLVTYVTLYSIDLHFQFDNEELFKIKKGQYSVYWFFTGGLTSMLLLIKCIHGIRFLWFSSSSYLRKIEANNKYKEYAGVQPAHLENFRELKIRK